LTSVFWIDGQAAGIPAGMLCFLLRISPVVSLRSTTGYWL
jgi:hypothetical protein